jgi:hypothetical protein
VLRAVILLMRTHFSLCFLKIHIRLALLQALLIFAVHSGKAQDSIAFKQTENSLPATSDLKATDSIAMAKMAKRFNPQKALLYAAILPGSGQVYTKKYWKVPIVYGGFIFLGYYIDSYNDNYRFFRGELFKTLNTKTNSLGLPEAQIRSIIDRYRRERDYFIVLTGLWYVLQIVDAHIDAHLKEFELNPNLQVRFEPSFTNDMMLGQQGGFSISIRF